MKLQRAGAFFAFDIEPQMLVTPQEFLSPGRQPGRTRGVYFLVGWHKASLKRS